MVTDMEIDNTSLTESDLPSPNADWSIINQFALSFNGYDHWGSFEKCAEIGNESAETFGKKKTLPKSLTDLRTSLFFEQRRWHHFGEVPDKQTMIYIHALVEAIREKIRTKEYD